MKTRNFLMLIAALWLYQPIAAWAVCLSPDGEHSGWHPSVEEDFKDSSKVVLAFVESGKTVSDREEPDNPEGVSGIVYKVNVFKTYKGDTKNEITVYDGRDSGQFSMELGVAYILFLYPGNDYAEYYVDNCGNSIAKYAVEAKSLMQKLDKLSASPGDNAK